MHAENILFIPDTFLEIQNCFFSRTAGTAVRTKSAQEYCLVHQVSKNKIVSARKGESTEIQLSNERRHLMDEKQEV